MSVYRRPNQNNYFSSSRTWMQDYRLSCKAVGLLARMLSMPPDWEFHQSELVKKLTEGEDAVRTYMIELVKYGYLLKLPRNRNADGKWGDVTYEVWDMPQIKEPLSDKDAEKIFTHSYNEKDFKSIYNRDLPKPDFPDQVELDRTDPGLQLKQEQEIEQRKQQQHRTAAAPFEIRNKKKTALQEKGFFPIHDCLKDVDIPIPDKEEITRMYSEAEVKRSLAWATHPTTKISQSLQQALKWACKNHPEIPKSPQDIASENKEAAARLFQTISSVKPKNVYYEVLNKNVEIGYLAGNCEPTVIDYSVNGFLEQLMNASKKYGIPIKV